MLSPVSNDSTETETFPLYAELKQYSRIRLQYKDIFEEIETMINDCGDDGNCYICSK